MKEKFSCNSVVKATIDKVRKEGCVDGSSSSYDIINKYV